MTATDSLLQVICATRMSRRAATTVALADAGRVHSVFRRCFNIKTTTGEWLTVAIEPFPQTPDAIIIRSNDAGLGVEQGMGVEICSSEISIPAANFTIALSKTKIFDTRRIPFVRTADNRERFAKNLSFAHKIIHVDGRTCDVPEFQRRAGPAVSMLREAILTDDIMTMRAQCERLIGLGIGLTPSGDDILSGIAAGVFLGGAACKAGGKHFLSVLRELLSDGTRTTDLSARSVQLCLEGEINDIVYEAARAILCGSESEIRNAIPVLIAQGGTSGTETAQGLCIGLQIADELSENLNPKTTLGNLC